MPEKPAQASGKTPRTFTSARTVMQLEGQLRVRFSPDGIHWSDPQTPEGLTAGVYTHVELHEQTAAIGSLPGPRGGNRRPADRSQTTSAA